MSSSPPGAAMRAPRSPSSRRAGHSARRSPGRSGRSQPSCAARAPVRRARGTGDHAALYAKYLDQRAPRAALGGLASPSTMTAYAGRPDPARRARSLSPSAERRLPKPPSGRRRRRTGRCGATVLAVTNAPGLPLARRGRPRHRRARAPQFAVATEVLHRRKAARCWLLVATRERAATGRPPALCCDDVVR